MSSMTGTNSQNTCPEKIRNGPWARRPSRMAMAMASTATAVAKTASAMARVVPATAMRHILYLSWEVDEECKGIVSHWFPHVRHFGDACNVDVKAVQAAVQEANPSGDAVVLVTAGPSCPDFSVIRSEAPGRAGPEGRKFSEFCDHVKELEPALAPRQFLLLCENVVFAQPSEADYFSGQLDAAPVAIDASDLAGRGCFGHVSNGLNFKRILCHGNPFDGARFIAFPD